MHLLPIRLRNKCILECSRNAFLVLEMTIRMHLLTNSSWQPMHFKYSLNTDKIHFRCIWIQKKCSPTMTKLKFHVNDTVVKKSKILKNSQKFSKCHQNVIKSSQKFSNRLKKSKFLKNSQKVLKNSQMYLKNVSKMQLNSVFPP